MSFLKEYRFRVLLALLLWVGLLGSGWSWYSGSRAEEYAFAAGPRGSESFRLASAIAEVFNRDNASRQLVVLETSGSQSNARLLADRQVELAVLQADTPMATNVQVLASLYSDAYQLIVRTESGIRRFPDLAGERVAIAPRGSGQYHSFWFLADHYGLAEEDLTALPMSEDAANFAMISGQVDAVFRVHAPGNIAIRELVRDHDMRIVPIRQAQALALKSPAIMPGVIPLGSYRGEPPLPKRDQDTAVLETVLATRAQVPNRLAKDLTSLVFERRAELAASERLAGFAQPVSSSGRISAPVHPGALQYYNREKPGLLQENTRLLSSLLYVVAIITSAMLAIRASLQRRHKKRLVAYNSHLMKLTEEANHCDDEERLRGIKQALVKILQDVVKDLESSRVNQDEFEHFSFLWSAADALVKEKLTQREARA